MPDECLYPPSRHSEYGQPRPWSSLVVETNVSKSLPRVRTDAAWWFSNSYGEVWIVYIVLTKKATIQVVLEQRQLALVGIFTPLSSDTVTVMDSNSTRGRYILILL